MPNSSKTWLDYSLQTFTQESLTMARMSHLQQLPSEIYLFQCFSSIENKTIRKGSEERVSHTCYKNHRHHRSLEHESVHTHTMEAFLFSICWNGMEKAKHEKIKQENSTTSSVNVE